MSVLSSLAINSIANISYTKEKILNKKIKQCIQESGLDFNLLKSKYDDSIETKNLSEEEYLSQLNDYFLEGCLNISANPLLKSTRTQTVENWLASDNECTDGKDDGHISFWSKVGNCIEGAAKTVVGTVYNIVSDPKKLITTVAMAALLTALSCTPAGAVILPVLGIITAGKLIVNGVQTIQEAVEKEKNAATDAEAKDAWEDIGEGGTKIAAGAYVGYQSVNQLNNIRTSGIENTISENAEAFSNEANIEKMVVDAVFDPGNIEVD